MKIQVALSLYPLKTKSVEHIITDFIDELTRTELSVIPGTMSTLI